jgi:hypothetical protein
MAAKCPSYTQINICLAPNTPYAEIEATLREVLTIPKLPGFGGCQPCFSGLDRFVFENPAAQKVAGG